MLRSPGRRTVIAAVSGGYLSTEGRYIEVGERMAVHGRFRRITRSSLLTVLLASMLMVVQSAGLVMRPAAAFAAVPSPGTQLGSVQLSVPCSSGIGVGVAFDGTNLWYSCYGQSPDLFRASPTTGQVSASYTIAGGLGALAYDAADNLIYAGYGGSNVGEVYSIQLDSHENVVSSNAIFNTCAFSCATSIDDGLTFDAGTHTLYFSPDTSTTIWHLSTSGTVIGSFPWAGTGCYNSGLAIGDELLFEGADGCTTVYVVDKATPTTLDFSFSTGGTRDENLACDDSTFGQDAIWSKDAYTPVVYAFAIPPGSCGTGGEPVGGGATGPKAQVLFVHGVTESYSDSKLFSKLRGQLASAFGAQYVGSFEYYQDAGDKLKSGGCNPAAPGEQTPPTPNPASGMPYDSSQNGLICDSEGDLGQNAVRLDAEIQRLYHSNGDRPVILMGYSMGGETIRSFLSYSTHVGDGVATTMVDSVVLMHGVEQGSWLADSSVIHRVPYFGSKIGNLIALAFPNPNRPATQQFAPASKYIHWVDSSSDKLPNIPMYNTWGDERVAVKHCVIAFTWACVSADIQNWGDMVLMPGTDNPTQTPVMGGEKFLPGGRSATRWEWAETDRIYWDPTIDPSMTSALLGVYNAPEQHTNYPSTEGQLTVADCKTGKPIAEWDELFRVISARMNGQTYACKP